MSTYCRTTCYDGPVGPQRDFASSALSVQQLIAQCAQCDSGGGNVTGDHFWTISSEAIAGASNTPRDNLRENVPTNPLMPTYVQTFLFGSATTESTAGALPNRMMYIHTTDDPLVDGDSDEGFFAAGLVTGTQWDYSNRGLAAATFNRNNISSGISSFSTGDGNTSSGDQSSSFGAGHITSGLFSASFGSGNATSGRSELIGGEKNVDGATCIANFMHGTGNRLSFTQCCIVSGAENTVLFNNFGQVIGSQNTVNGGTGSGYNFVGGRNVVMNTVATNEDNFIYGRNMNISASSEFRVNTLLGLGHLVSSNVTAARFNCITGQSHSLLAGQYQSNLMFGDSLSFLVGGVQAVNVTQNLIGGQSHQCAGTISQNLIGGDSHLINTITLSTTLRSLIVGERNATQDIQDCVVSGNSNELRFTNNSCSLVGENLTLRRTYNSVISGANSRLVSLNSPVFGGTDDMCNFLFARSSAIDNSNSINPTSRLNNNAIFGGENQNILVSAASTGELLNNVIIGGNSNTVQSQAEVESCGIFEGINNTISADLGTRALCCAHLGGQANTIFASTVQLDRSVCVGGTSNTITTLGSTAPIQNSVIVGGQNLTLNSGSVDTETVYVPRFRVNASIQHKGFIFVNANPLVYVPTIDDHLIVLGDMSPLANDWIVSLPSVTGIPDGITYYIRAGFAVDPTTTSITIHTPLGIPPEAIYSTEGGIAPAGPLGNSQFTFADQAGSGTISGVRIIAKQTPVLAWYIVSTINVQ